jgi:hypothetical protein
MNRFILVTALFIYLLTSRVFAQVHTSYLWHLHQPIYWAEQSAWDPYAYQKAWESHWLKMNNGNWYSDGQQHPLNDLYDIFNKDDRKAVYQWRVKDAVQSLLGHAEAGAQVCYSGSLIENVNSLANAGQMGYYSGWQNNYITARGWQTSGGKPRLDITAFTMDHSLSPLISDRVLRKQIQVYRQAYTENFGSNPYFSKGYWPAECSFSERIIKALVQEGIEWSVIANSHLARTLNDYPLNFGTSGCNIDPPNGADKVATNGVHWWSGQIDGRGGAFAAPYCYQAHKAKYVDPETGTEYLITVVPMCDLLSYKNGYALMGTGEIDSYIAPYNAPGQPSMVLFAHDGDNAWGGGYDYYANSVPQLANACAANGYVPSTIQQFLTNHPVPANDIVHVEDGSWFNAENDWGHPQFINWMWPMYTGSYEFNPNGWTEDARNWAVLTAAENRVLMAEDLSGGADIADILHPGSGSTAAERAWHHILPAFSSDFMYYGTSLDMEVKQSLACNLATDFANQVISAHPGVDNTPPSVFIPQRYPYNPGGIGFGPTYGYQQHQNSSDFFVWTFAYDVSGLQSVTLKYRTDNDGSNPLTNNENDTYSGGTGVSSWQSIAMTFRDFPEGNFTNNPDINFFIMPDYCADEYYAQITGLSEVLVDYYVEAMDNEGNIAKTAIQHVYVGVFNPGGGGGEYNVTWLPVEPDENDVITITVANPTSVPKLHWGVNNQGSNWQTPNAAYWTPGTYLFNGTGPAVETPFSGPNIDNEYTLMLGPFNNPAQAVAVLAFVIHFQDGSWDNNNGSDYHIAVGSQTIIGVQWEPENPTQYDVITVNVGQATQGAKLHWGVKVNGNLWQSPNPVYWLPGSYLFNGTGPAVETPMNGPVNGVLLLNIGPFNSPVQEVQGIDFVIHYNNNTWDNNNGQDYHIIITPLQPSYLDLKVFLEGPFTGTSMVPGLIGSDEFPLSQPFNTGPWNYQGSEIVASVPNQDIVDWVLVELRDAISASQATSSTIILRKAGFILSDGHIRDIDGSANLQLLFNIQHNLYIVVHQRNHLSVMSANSLIKSLDTYTYDFSTSSNQVYGSVAGHKQLASGRWGMIGGDGNKDGTVDDLDKSGSWNGNAGQEGYLESDYNLDAQADNRDKDDIWLPNAGRGCQVPE